MNIWHMVLRELGHRKANFVLGLLSVATAVGCLVGALTLLNADAIRTEVILANKKKEVEQAIDAREQEVQAAGEKLQDAMRKITKGLGFNILVLPHDQNLQELHIEGTPSKTMPEAYVKTLAESSIVTVNHLLPIVSQKVKWEEQDGMTVVLTGTRGEVPIAHRDPKKPLQDQVPEGTMVVGYQVHQQRGLNKDDKVTLMGKTFTVTQTYAERGTTDDSTVWVNLREAQEMLGKENLVHAILALECNCATEDRVAEIRQEIAAILPGTQVIERGPPALARAEARNKAKATADQALEKERAAGVAALKLEADSRLQQRQQRESFAAVLVPLVILGCAVWVGFLAFTNVRQRSAEIGILRAIGVRSTQILAIFLSKAFILGLLGAGVGYVAGFAIGVAWGDLSASAEGWSVLFAPQLLLLAFVLAPLLAVVASWIPAMLAAGQDPATVLQEG